MAPDRHKVCVNAVGSALGKEKHDEDASNNTATNSVGGRTGLEVSRFPYASSTWFRFKELVVSIPPLSYSLPQRPLGIHFLVSYFAAASYVVRRC